MRRWIARLLVRTTGKAEWPSTSYVQRKLSKYLLHTPFVYAKAYCRQLTGYQPRLRAGQHFVFIGGLHRSGTSVLHRILEDHRQVSGIKHTVVPEDEGQHLQTVFAPDSTYGVLFAFEPAARLSRLVDTEAEIAREALLKQWGRFLDFNKPVLLEKSPSNLVRTRYLESIFPGSLFIIVVRHPIAYALAVRKWTRAPLSRILEHWGIAHACMLSDFQGVRTRMICRYEDLVRDPVRHFEIIWKTIGLKPVEPKEQLIDANRHYFELWNRMTSLERNGCDKQYKNWSRLWRALGYYYESPFVDKDAWNISDRLSSEEALRKAWLAVPNDRLSCHETKHL